MMWVGIFVILLVYIALYINIPSLINIIVVYVLGNLIVRIIAGYDKNIIYKLYHSIFTIGTIYLVMTFIFMTRHNYEYLLAPDIYYYFLPRTQEYLSYGDINKAFNEIWKEYNIFSRFQPGYFTYSTLFACLTNWLGGNFYFGQQISVLLVFSVVGVILYKLFRVNNFIQKKAYHFTLLICTFSIVYSYSSQILRDMHILLIYLYGIYLTFENEFNLLTLSKIIAVIIVCATFRIESAMFLAVLIPTYLILTLKSSKRKFVAVIISSTVGLAGIISSISYFSQINYIIDSNHEAYSEDLGSGIIGNLQSVPIVGQFSSIIYNAVQPVPFWRRFSPSENAKWGHEVYNIMNFPRSFASFFNWMVFVFIIYWLISPLLREGTKKYITRPFKYHLWIGLMFLLLQSAVIAQRRLMAYYCVYYILFFIIQDRVSNKHKLYLFLLTIISFIAIQITGLLILI